MEFGTSITCPACGRVQGPGPQCADCGAPLASLVSRSSQPLLVGSSVFLLPPRESPPPEEPPPPPRRSWLAVSSLVGSIAFWPALVLLADTLGCQRLLPPAATGPLYLVVLACLLVSILVGGVALIRIKRSQNRLSGQRFAQLGVSLGMTNVLLGIGVLPNLMGAENRARYERGATESRAAINQVLAYAKRMGAYPTSLHALRTIGIAPIRDKDPWGNDWVLSPELVQGSQPGPGDDVYIYSRGPRGTAIYRPGVSRTGGNGAVGYSTRHGSFRGC